MAKKMIAIGLIYAFAAVAWIVLGSSLASAVSVFLVISYLRLVAGLRFAAVSYAHFFEGLTGLIVTCGGILTLFALMQMTGRVDWARHFAPPSQSTPEPGVA